MIGNFMCSLTALLLLLFGTSAFAQNDEEKVGKAGAAQVLGAAPLSDSDAVQQYVNKVGYSVAQFSGVNYKWHFGVVKSDALNAFAMPGGYILLSSGLLKTLESEDELAFVLAHEIAHVARKHHYQIVLRQRLANQAAKNLEGAIAESDIAKLAQASGQIYARGLDKTAEYEADGLGVEYFTRAGYDPAAALNVLEKLQQFSGGDPRAELLFSTHPSPADRLDGLLRAGIDKLPRPTTRRYVPRESRYRAFLNLL